MSIFVCLSVCLFVCSTLCRYRLGETSRIMFNTVPKLCAFYIGHPYHHHYRLSGASSVLLSSLVRTHTYAHGLDCADGGRLGRGGGGRREGVCVGVGVCVCVRMEGGWGGGYSRLIKFCSVLHTDADTDDVLSSLCCAFFFLSLLLFYRRARQTRNTDWWIWCVPCR
jgi:hypothetical protein